MTKLRVVLAEDHNLVRHGIKAVLEASEKYQVIGEANTADETTTLVSEVKPDLLVLDLGLPQKSGIEVIYELRKLGSETQVVVLTMHDNELMVKQAMNAGARAYVLKDFSPEALLSCVEKATQGEIVLPTQYEHLREELEASAPEPGDQRASDEGDPLSKLSKREREVFFLLADGMPNRTIAKKLFISPRTVETHRARVIKKLGFSSTADLIRYAIKNHLLTP